MSPKAGRREWIGLAVIALPCLLYSMDLTVLDLAVPQLTAALHPSSTQLLWIVDIYGFILAGMLIPMGALGDRIGRRRLLMIGASAFGTASILAAFSTSAAMLIAARALLGVAGATLAPSTLSLIRSMFHDDAERSRAVGVWIMSYSAGGALGPILGGALLDHFRWGTVFLLGVPVMVLLLVVGPRLLPEFRDPDAGPVDLVSAFMSITSVLLVIYGIKQFARGEFGPVDIVTMCAGVLFSVLFIRRQRALDVPMIDLTLFRSRAFSVALGAYTLTTFVAFGIFLFLTQYLQLVKGLTSFTTGLYVLPIFIAFSAGSMIAPPLARRFGPGALMATGLVIATSGLLILARTEVTTSLVIITAGVSLYAIGLSPVFVLTTDMMVGAAPISRAGAASALSETGSEFGGALGIAILGSIGTAVYRTRMAHVAAADVSDVARNTIGGAMALAAQLPPDAANHLATAARESFTHALDAAALASAVLTFAGALVSARSFGRAAHACQEDKPSLSPRAKSSYQDDNLSLSP